MKNPALLTIRISLLALLLHGGIHLSGCSHSMTSGPEEHAVGHDSGIEKLHKACDVDGSLREDILTRAVLGSQSLDFPKRDILTIVDFSQPSTAKRCYVIDLINDKLLFQTLVSHGEGTGENMATEFSNEDGSHQSSLGFYRTAETYEGKNGYSLRLDGLEPQFNGAARSRYIVIHGAKYVSEQFVSENGRLGRSWGCPAFPVELTTPIIDTIKDGSCLYIHADDEAYLAGTAIRP